MKQQSKLFNGRKLRAVYDADKKIWLVSVVDLLAAIRNSSYDTARNYWKQLKFRLRNIKHPLGLKTRQIKLLAKDGMHRYTDVMDYKEIVKLIQLLPYKAALAEKNWLCEIASKSEKLEKDLAGCIVSALIPKKHWFVRSISFKRLF